MEKKKLRLKEKKKEKKEEKKWAKKIPPKSKYYKAVELFMKLYTTMEQN